MRHHRMLIMNTWATTNRDSPDNACALSYTMPSSSQHEMQKLRASGNSKPSMPTARRCSTHSVCVPAKWNACCTELPNWYGQPHLFACVQPPQPWTGSQACSASHSAIQRPLLWPRTEHARSGKTPGAPARQVLLLPTVPLMAPAPWSTLQSAWAFRTAT